MVDITKKPPIYREATAYGKIKLKKETIDRILRGEVKKGDVLTVARIAAVQAVKDTPRLIPLCHPIPITGVEVKFNIGEEHVEVEVTVRSIGQTGVEMEALSGVTAALLNVWDMVKYLEKDERGNYPITRIEEVKVLRKIKGRERKGG